jgi:hypothetical protein
MLPMSGPASSRGSPGVAEGRQTGGHVRSASHSLLGQEDAAEAVAAKQRVLPPRPVAHARGSPGGDNWLTNLTGKMKQMIGMCPPLLFVSSASFNATGQAGMPA